MAESQRSFAGLPGDVHLVRRYVQEALEDLGVNTDEAALVVGEMATNAVVHAPGPFAVIVRCSETAVMVGVTDSSQARPTLRAGDVDSVHGHGIRIVERLAEAWYVEDAPGGKTVWARLRRL